eukprot:Selendium_serpulae@DN1958_c0_g1_i1.p2
MTTKLITALSALALCAVGASASLRGFAIRQRSRRSPWADDAAPPQPAGRRSILKRSPAADSRRAPRPLERQSSLRGRPAAAVRFVRFALESGGSRSGGSRSALFVASPRSRRAKSLLDW